MATLIRLRFKGTRKYFDVDHCLRTTRHRQDHDWYAVY
jgi:hypothetical protein